MMIPRAAVTTALLALLASPVALYLLTAPLDRPSSTRLEVNCRRVPGKGGRWKIDTRNVLLPALWGPFQPQRHHSQFKYRPLVPAARRDEVPEIPDDEKLRDKSVSQLKNLCRKFGLPSSGARAQLLERLREAKDLMKALEDLPSDEIPGFPGESEIPDEIEVAQSSSIQGISEESEEVEEEEDLRREMAKETEEFYKSSLETAAEGEVEDFAKFRKSLEDMVSSTGKTTTTITKSSPMMGFSSSRSDNIPPDFIPVYTAPTPSPIAVPKEENIDQKNVEEKATFEPKPEEEFVLDKASWMQLGIKESQFLDGLTRLQIRRPNALQVEAIPMILEGNDCVLAAATGSGKTLTFLLPMITRTLLHQKADSSPKKDDTNWPKMVVVVPGQELARQVSDVASELLQYRKGGAPSMYLTGGDDKARQNAILNRRKPEVLVGTPARLLEVLKKGLISLSSVNSIVLDECDVMLREEFIQQLPVGRSGVQTVLSSASAADHTVLRFARERFQPNWEMHGVSEESMGTTLVSDTIVHTLHLLPRRQPQRRRGGQGMMRRGGRGQWSSGGRGGSEVGGRKMKGRGDDDGAVLRKKGPRDDPTASVLDRKLSAAVRLFLEDEPSGVLLFVNGPGSVKTVVKKLHEQGVWWALPLSGSMETEERVRVVKRLAKASRGDLDETIPGEVLVATDVASRGLDPPLLSHVINIDVPRNLKSYAHRAGRCGRAGRPGLVVTLAGNETEACAAEDLGAQIGAKVVRIDI